MKFLEKKILSFKKSVVQKTVAAFFLFVGLSLSATYTTAQIPQKPEELQHYLQKALQYSPEIRAAVYAYEAQLARLPQTGLLPEPEVMLGFYANPENGGSIPGRFAFGVQQMLPWPGTLSAEKEAEQFRARAALYNLHRIMQEVLEEVEQRWMEYYYFEQVVLLMDSQLELLEELMPIAAARFSSGIGTKADVLRLEMEIQRMTTMVLNHHDQIKPTLIAFNNLLERSNFELISIPDTLAFPILTYQDWELLRLARQQNPELMALEEQRRSYEKNRELARMNGFPDFSVGIEVMGRDYAGMMLMDKEAVVAQVGIRIPIQRNRYRAAQNEAMQQASQVRATSDTRLAQIESELLSVYKRYRNQERNSWLYAREMLPRAYHIHELLLEAYANGDASLDEILQIQRDIIDYKLQVHESAVEGWKLISRIQSLTGSFDISEKAPQSDQF